MAALIGPGVTGGFTGEVHDSQLSAIGQRAYDKSGNEYVYLKGVGSTLAGSWVTFDEVGVTALLAANAIGPVAVATAAIVANKFGWYQIFGTVSALVAANTADNARLGRETTDGYAGDGRAAGDEIIGAISRGSTAGAAALTTCQLFYPLVNDITGA
jgi:hypothetical protein